MPSWWIVVRGWDSCRVAVDYPPTTNQRHYPPPTIQLTPTCWDDDRRVPEVRAWRAGAAPPREDDALRAARDRQACCDSRSTTQSPRSRRRSSRTRERTRRRARSHCTAFGLRSSAVGPGMSSALTLLAATRSAREDRRAGRLRTRRSAPMLPVRCTRLHRPAMRLDRRASCPRTPRRRRR